MGVSEVANLFGGDVCDVFSDSQNWLAEEMVSVTCVVEVFDCASELVFSVVNARAVNVVSFGFDLGVNLVVILIVCCRWIGLKYRRETLQLIRSFLVNRLKCRLWFHGGFLYVIGPRTDRFNSQFAHEFLIGYP